MIKSNWPIKNLIMSLDLIFMQILPIIIQFDLEFAFLNFFYHTRVQLGLKFPLKLQLYSPACFLHFSSLCLIIFFEKKMNFRPCLFAEK
jgi:hypothetical protein